MRAVEEIVAIIIVFLQSFILHTMTTMLARMHVEIENVRKGKK
jgi:hypothetical protein